MGLEGLPGYFILRPPRPTVFRVLDCKRYKSVGDAEEMCFRERLAFCRYEGSALVESLDETLKWLLHIIGGEEPLLIS